MSNEHIINPSGRTLSEAERQYRTALVEAHEQAAAAEAQRRPASPEPARPDPVPTRLTEGPAGELLYPDGTPLEHEPGVGERPRTMPRVGGGPYGINRKMLGLDGPAGDGAA